MKIQVVSCLDGPCEFAVVFPDGGSKTVKLTARGSVDLDVLGIPEALNALQAAGSVSVVEGGGASTEPPSVQPPPAAVEPVVEVVDAKEPPPPAASKKRKRKATAPDDEGASDRSSSGTEE
jgi:hypothetical protein